ncbi:MAG: PKD domain-containing protein [Bacteroidota bacterium]|nr:PKD domain-containing protein [Bacteroidota bacterium]
METKLTLKQFIILFAFVITAFVGEAQNYGNIEFIENKGQWDSRVKYKGDVSAGAFFIRSGGFTVLKYNPDDYEKLHAMGHAFAGTGTTDKTGKMILRGHAYNVDFLGGAKDLEIIPDKAISTYNNYFIGNDPSKWAGECHIYQAITYKNVYPNVDVRYYTDKGTLKYDIIARPGADISRIALKYEGADKLSVKNKELIIGTSIGDMRESIPYSYQSDSKERKELTCKYAVKDNVVRFEVKNYDPNATLVIDPNMIFCSFSGSNADNWGFTATYGPDGSFFGGGIVFDNGFPVSAGAFQTVFDGGVADHPGRIDMGIIKLSPTGSNRVYATYIGGSGNEQPHSLVVDPQGELIVAGRSNSPDYPITGANTLAGGGYDIVVTKLNAAGSALIGSKKIGGDADDGVNIKVASNGANSLQHNYGDGSRSEVIIDGSGNIYVASCTSSANFPGTAGSFQPTIGGLQDGILLKFPPNVSGLTFARYLGGSENDAAYVLSISPLTGDIFVAGGTESTNFPGNHAGTVGPASNGGIDGFVAEIKNDGSALVRSAYIGTNGYDQVYGIQFDRNGFPYVMGQTTGNWPVINALYSDAGAKQFIGKLQPDLSAYVYSTVFGTASPVPNISPTAFLVDRCENVYVSGWGGIIASGYQSAGTTGMRVTPDAYKATSVDNADFYFFVLKKNATQQLYGSFFGQDGGLGDHVDGGTSRFDANGVIYQAICANCGGGPRFPTTVGSAYPNHNVAAAYCNLAMVKMSFNLAGVGSSVQSAINGVPKDTSGCVPLTVVFTDQVRNAVQYIWNFGDGPDSPPLSAGAPDNGYTQTHIYNAVGTYRVMLVAIDPNSCNIRDTSYIHIRVGDIKADLAGSYQKLDPCEQFNYRFHNLSTTAPSRPFTNTSFIWDFGDGSPRVVAGLNDVDHIYPGPGTYSAFLVLNDTAYCNDPDSIKLDVRVSANVVAKFDTPPVGCAPYSAGFANTSDGGLTFQWNFGDPGSGANNTSTDINPTHLYNDPGTYTITMVANDPNTCNKTDTTTFTIIVYEKPLADFSFTPVTPVENTPNTFTNLASGIATKFKWLFGDGDTLLTTSRAPVQHQYNATGTFNACLVAFNDVGCSDTACKSVSTIVVPVLDVPNAFTPNSGDVNSIVYVRGFGIAKMRFIIWNRWGQKVFETNNRFEGWDGKVKGVVQPMDVYAYTLDVEFFDKTKTTRKGDITLIR